MNKKNNNNCMLLNFDFIEDHFTDSGTKPWSKVMDSS